MAGENASSGYSGEITSTSSGSGIYLPAPEAYVPNAQIYTSQEPPLTNDPVADPEKESSDEKETWLKKKPSKKTLILIGIGLTLVIVSIRFYLLFKPSK